MKMHRFLSPLAAGLVVLWAGGCAWNDGKVPPPDLTGVWTSADGASGRPGGSVVETPPMNPGAKRRHEAFNAIVSPTGDTPGGVCLGAGMPAVLLGAGGYPMEIIQRPEQVTMIFELHGEIRRIYFGERNMPEEDRVPGRNGYSSGRWEGDTLVVETNNLVEQLDQRSTPHSASATIVERYRLDGKDEQGRRILVAEVTMNDPEFYTAPVVFTRRWAEVPNGHLLPYECNEELWMDRVESLAKKAGLDIP
ncbi:MAG: hypothetical protein DIU62_006000 [Pseudomonadota bacterium]|jgi:hypothetical protein